MAAVIAYLDTHVVVMATQGTKMPRRAIATMRKATTLRISPATLLELQFLREIGRIKVAPQDFVEALREAFTVEVCPRPFVEVAEAALRLSWTRDPFDRLIAAQAALADSVLVTKDQAMLDHCEYAHWD